MCALRSAPATWTKRGDIYSDESSRDVFVCSACLDREDSFELAFQSADASSFWTHVRVLHGAPAPKHENNNKRKPFADATAQSDKRQKLATTAPEQRTKKVNAEDVVVIEIDADPADRDSDRRSDKTNTSGELNTLDKSQTAVAAIKSEAISPDIIMDCKIESEVLVTQDVARAAVYESPIVVINLIDDEDENTVVFGETSTEPPMTLERSHSHPIVVKQSDIEHPERNANNESSASPSVVNARPEEKQLNFNVKQEHLQQDLSTDAEDCEDKSQELFGELRVDEDVAEAAMNASSDEDEDLLRFFKECSVADYEVIELSDDDADDDSSERNIYSPSLFSSNDNHEHKQGYACTCPKCMETFSDSADFKEHLKIHLQEDLRQQLQEAQRCQQQPQQPTAMPQQHEQHQQPNVENSAANSIDHAATPPSSPQRGQPTPPNGALLTCNHCQQTFCHAWQLLRHLRVHEKVQRHKKTPQKAPQKTPQKTPMKRSLPFRCEKCGKRTSTEVAMQRHIGLYHSDVTNADTAKCHVCARLLRKTSLQQHLLTHSSERCYKCQLCNYASKQKQSLNLHIRNRHPEVLTDRQRRRRAGGKNTAAAAAAPLTPPAEAAAEKPQLTPAEELHLYEIFLSIQGQLQHSRQNNNPFNAMPNAPNFVAPPPHYLPRPLPPHPYGPVSPDYAIYPTQSQFGAHEGPFLPTNTS